MNYSMEDYLKIVTPYFHADLVSPAARSHIQSLAQILPPFSNAGLECRLDAGQSRVDLQVNLPCVVPNLPERFLADPVWQFFQEFCHEWALPTSSLHQAIKDIWLEFDVAQQPSQIPMPCIFLGLNSEAHSVNWLIELALKLSQHSSPLLESNLQLCADALPAGASISHLGAMLSRSAKGVRVNVCGISAEQLSDYLKQIGWSDPSDTFSSLVSTLPRFTDFITLSFDVGDRVYPRIGLECFLKEQPKADPRWQLFLNYLVAEGLCTLAKRDALLAWEGFSQRSSAPELWPRNISWGDRLLGSRAISIFWRGLNHLKLIYQPGSSLEAKAYLAFGHGWFAPNVLTQTEQKTVDRNQPHLPMS